VLSERTLAVDNSFHIGLIQSPNSNISVFKQH